MILANANPTAYLEQNTRNKALIVKNLFLVGGGVISGVSDTGLASKISTAACMATADSDDTSLFTVTSVGFDAAAEAASTSASAVGVATTLESFPLTTAVSETFLATATASDAFCSLLKVRGYVVRIY